jgi:hypothetical protein
LGQLYTVHPKLSELFFFTFLLVNVLGPMPFEFLWTKYDRVLNTYQYVCHELQLMEYAELIRTKNNIRHLFAIILTFCPTQSSVFWYKKRYMNMTGDTLHRVKQTNQYQNIDNTPNMYNDTSALFNEKQDLKTFFQSTLQPNLSYMYTIWLNPKRFSNGNNEYDPMTEWRSNDSTQITRYPQW